jgi:hypothetical protein
LVSRAGSALLAQVADKLGLKKALSLRLAGIEQRRGGHDPGRVMRDLAVMLADGGEGVSDLGAVRDQEAWFGPVASDRRRSAWSTGSRRSPACWSCWGSGTRVRADGSGSCTSRPSGWTSRWSRSPTGTSRRSRFWWWRIRQRHAGPG